MARLIALIPAHNEQENIEAAIASATQPGVDEIVVVSDNSTDDTASLARAVGARVIESVDNSHKKAGALNQVLATELPRLRRRDYVMVMDADSIIDPGFVQAALAHFRRDPKLGGIGGTFRGGPGGGLVGMLQRNEYARYARDVERLNGRALVLTGTASVFRAAALDDVVTARRTGRLPEGGGEVYDEKVLTEDNELTLALLHLGWKILAPDDCLLTTEVMPTWLDLARQRLRWKRGAFENLHDYGVTRITLPYWGRQAMSLVSVIATVLYLGTMAWVLVAGSFVLSHFWLGVTAIFVLERVVTVRERGIAQQLLAATLVVETIYDVWLQLVQARAFLDVALRRKAAW